MTTIDTPYSHSGAWDKAAELQRKGYVTRVWRDASGWRVGYMTHQDYERGMEENKK